jgi:dipeptidyl aminopeptidase/acylaminoacyl peptidase
MNDRRSTDRLLSAWLELQAPASAPDDLRTDIHSATASIRPRPGWVARIGGHHMDVITGGAGRRKLSLAPILLVVGLLLALVAGAIYVGSTRQPDQLALVPPSVPPSAAQPTQASIAPPTLSPDAPTGLIAFTRAGVDRNIAVAPPDGGSIRALITTPGDDDQPAWSIDNSQIAWSGQPGIWIANADGTGAAQFTDGGTMDRGPAWSPDGSQLVFASSRDGDLDLYTQHLGQTDITPLTTNDVDDDQPSWSAVANRIAFASSRGATRDVWTMNPDGSDLVQLTGDEGNEEGPAWSPDGSKIAFSSDREGTSFIYVMNADGSEVERLVAGSAIEDDPTWSPDGRFIAFQRSPSPSAIVIVDVESHQEVGSISQGMNDLMEPAWRAP